MSDSIFPEFAMRQYFILSFLALLACGRALLAADTIKLTDGKTVAGTIESTTATDVNILAQPAKTSRKIPVNEIDWIAFDNEPNALREVRAAIRQGKFELAQKLMARVSADEADNTNVKTEVNFYKGFCLALQAISGAGNKQTKAEAITLLTSLGRNQADSFHYYDVCELLGNVFVATGTPEKALPLFEQIAKAPWLEFQMRGHVLAGRALVAQEKFDEAGKRFNTAAVLAQKGAESDRQLAAAKIGAAQVLSLTGKQNQAIEQLLPLIAKLPEEQAELLARAYNVLGHAYEAADKKKEALLSYLHVSLLYSNYSEQHAEALGRVAVLFLDVYKKNSESEKARKELSSLYPNSKYAGK